MFSEIGVLAAMISIIILWVKVKIKKDKDKLEIGKIDWKT